MDEFYTSIWDGLPLSRESFVCKVEEQGSSLYRSLPWRDTFDPYEILVSEVMLQQTQVARVLKKWTRFISLFPTVDALAASDTSTVLEAWQGLGYNRRALSLKKTCEICSATYQGRIPDNRESLLDLPGIGPATAAGVLAFAFQKPAIYIETNVRTVFIHELFPHEESINDKRLVPLVEDSVQNVHPRDWYYALLDYGSWLKRSVANASTRSVTYAKQSKFEGSHRQKRAEILRIVLASPGITLAEVKDQLDSFETSHGRDAIASESVLDIMSELQKDGFFSCRGNRFYA